MKGKWIVFILALWAPVHLIGQFASTIHYTVKDGLPSSTNYVTTQDSLGFLWIGTEAGLVRFDGAKFKVYTTLDGLPDNEVLGLAFDNVTNRLWVITYSKAACYFRDGRFYTSKNDSSLLSIKCDFGEFVNANKQEKSGVFLYNGASIYECANNKITKFQMNIAPIFQVRRWSDSTFDFLCDSGALGYKMGDKFKTYYSCFDTALSYNHGRWIDDSTLCRYMPGKVLLYRKQSNGDYHYITEIKIDAKRGPTRVLLSNNHLYICVAMEGIFMAENAVGSHSQKIWAGNVNDINIDNASNLWITTNDDGIYVIKNTSLLNYSIDNLLIHDNITALYLEQNGALYIGNSYGEMFSMHNYVLHPIKIRDKSNLEKVRAITRYDDKLFFITNNSTTYLNQTTGIIKEFPHSSGGPKSLLFLKDKRTVLVGLLASILAVDTKTDSFYEDLHFHKRIIDIAQHPDGRVFCGSLDGVYTYVDHNLSHVESEDPRLSSRVTSLCFTADSLLWIGTPANGVMAYNGKKIVANISQYQYMGYHGTICRKIARGNPNEVWVATNYGINKISYHLSDTVVIDNITPLNMTDGLLSDDVNDIVVRDSMVYVATSYGLTVLNENRMASAANIPIYITSIRINDKDSSIHDGEYCLTYQQNNLKVEYVGILLPSAGYLRYQYRLLGTGNDKWETTSNTSIEFRSLSPGTYTFEAAVLDKFGKRSRSIARVSFKITPAFYQTVWFWAIVFIMFMVAGFYFIRARFKTQQLRYEKEQSLNNKIIELEQQALKAQMNPHFIFNCLTAVQHFVNTEDLYSANMYLSNFAKLIRKTLDLSGEQYISLDKEVAYLTNYVQLEKMRFQEKFKYQIDVAPDIDQYNVMIPPMLLQPIIENAIRHGLRNMDTDTGLLKIEFTQNGNKIICTIDDNGVGMKKAMELKTTMHVEYQSKGMKLTMSRIQAINMISDKKITIEIHDKHDSNNVAAGTLVILGFEQQRSE